MCNFYHGIGDWTPISKYSALMMHRCVFSYLTAVSSQVIGAGGSVLAGVWLALVHLLLTVAAHVSGLTSAQVCVTHVNTLTRVTAQNGHRHSWEKVQNFNMTF